jgi:hypothetical protein
MRALPCCMFPALALALAASGAACGEDADARVGACMDYCELVMRHCQGSVAQYTDVSTCQATCGAMPLGDPLSPTGNTISCRTFQAALAEDATRLACTRAGPGGDSTCGDNCESFCASAGELCPDAYADDEACRAACAGFSTTEVYDASDIGSDTFACRLYHLTAASTDPDTHCAHIGVVSPTCL